MRAAVGATAPLSEAILCMIFVCRRRKRSQVRTPWQRARQRASALASSHRRRARRRRRPVCGVGWRAGPLGCTACPCGSWVAPASQSRRGRQPGRARR
jgi:hypothetical protein